MAYHWLPGPERAARDNKIVSLWNTDPELGLTLLGRRFSMSSTQVGNIVRAALKDGRTTRQIEPVPYGADCKDEV